MESVKDGPDRSIVYVAQVNYLSPDAMPLLGHQFPEGL